MADTRVPDWAVDWKADPPPFFALVWRQPKTDQFPRSPSSFGSGVLLAPGKVLTCAHVLFDQSRQTVTRTSVWDEAKEGAFDNKLETIPDAIWVRLGGQSVQATVSALTGENDLAVLDVPLPDLGIRAPLVPREERQSCVGVYAGFQARDGEYHFDIMAVQLTALHETDGYMKHDIGAPEGFSGGAVFAAPDGRIEFCGIACHGGKSAALGGIVPAGRVAWFLDKHGLSLPDRSDISDDAGYARGVGLDMRFLVGTAPGDPGTDSPLILRTVRDTIRDNHLCRMSTRPLSMAEVWSSTGRRCTDTIQRDMPGHVPDEAAVTSILEAANAHGRVSLRLPSPDELTAIAHQEAATPPKNDDCSAIGFDHFGQSSAGFHTPPKRVSEWVNCPANGLQLMRRVGLNGLEPVSPGSVPDERRVMRLAMDIG